jgi:hypothetical protein
MVLGIGIREGVLRVSVSDVSLAIGGLSQSFKRKVKDLAFWFLCYGSDCDHEYSGFSPGIVPGIEPVDCMLVVLWRIPISFGKKYCGISKQKI